MINNHFKGAPRTVTAILCMLPCLVGRSQDADTTMIRAIGPQEHRGTAADTARIDILLDSAKAWVSGGETVRSAAAAREAARTLEALGPKAGGLHARRRLKAAQYEGMAHHYAGRYAPALAAFQRMENAAMYLREDALAAAALTYQAYEYRSMADLDRALEMTRRAVDLLRPAGPSIHLANAHAGLGNIHFDKERMDSAMFHRTRALELYDTLGLGYYSALTMQDLAEVHMHLEQYDPAMALLDRARPELENSENMPERCVFLAHLARALFAQGRIDESEQAISRAREAAADLDNAEHRYKQDELLALIASERKQPLEALRRMDAARNAIMQDQDHEKIRALTEVRLQAEHEKEALLAAEDLAAERRQTRNAYVLAGLVLIIAVLLLRSYLASRRNARAMAAKHAALLQTQEQLVRSERQREAEQLRTHIARDIHDEMGGELAKIRLLGEEALHLLDTEPEQAADALERMRRSARTVADSMRDIVWATDPRNDSLASTVDHARDLVNRLLEGTGIHGELDMRTDGADGPVAPGRKTHLMRIIKEGLTNVIRHAGATRVDVRLLAGPEGFDLCIEDDGRGLPEESIRNGNGLRNMRARAEALGAAFSMERSPQGGVRIHLHGGPRSLQEGMA